MIRSWQRESVRRKDLTRSPQLVRVLGVAAAGMLAAGACGQGGGGGPTENLDSDETLEVAIGEHFGALDPAQVNAEPESEAAPNLLHGLLKYDRNLNLVPDIATSMPTISSDGLTYTFKLRSDVTFSNGDKVTAKDVVYSWNRAAAQQGPYSTNLSAIAGFDKLST